LCGGFPQNVRKCNPGFYSAAYRAKEEKKLAAVNIGVSNFLRLCGGKYYNKNNPVFNTALADIWAPGIFLVACLPHT
jgi:hypothetical protein